MRKNRGRRWTILFAGACFVCWKGWKSFGRKKWRWSLNRRKIKNQVSCYSALSHDVTTRIYLFFLAGLAWKRISHLIFEILFCPCCLFPFPDSTRHIAGAHFPHHDPLGPGVIHPKPRVSAYDVQPPSQAVWRTRWTDASTSQGLHHQQGVDTGHHGSPGVLGSDPLPAYCADGSRGGEAHNSKHWVYG